MTARCGTGYLYLHGDMHWEATALGNSRGDSMTGELVGDHRGYLKKQWDVGKGYGGAAMDGKHWV